MTDYISNPLSTLNADLNTVQTQLEAKADISSLNGLATDTYVQQYVGEVLTGDISVDLSGYVPSTRTVNGHQLTSDVAVTSADLGLSSEIWTFTLSDDSVVTRTVCVFPQ